MQANTDVILNTEQTIRMCKKEYENFSYSFCFLSGITRVMEGAPSFFYAVVELSVTVSI